MIKILLVDDEVRWLEDLKWAAQGEARKLFEARSEEEALQKISEERFHLIVTDLRLKSGGPDTGGLRILNAAKEKDIFTQVIVCTAHGTPANSVSAIRAGAFDYLERNPAGTDPLPFLQYKISQALEFRDAMMRRSEQL